MLDKYFGIPVAASISGVATIHVYEIGLQPTPAFAFFCIVAVILAWLISY